MVERLTRPAAQPFDILIIGGGITGAGAARDAACRGLRVCLVEQDDFASGTSSRSSKLVHGGLRYLEQGEFSLVFEAVTERRILMNIAPHLVNPLAFLFPVFADSRRGVFTVNVGMWLYDGLSLFRSPKIHKNLSRKDVRQCEPLLRQEGLKGAPMYYDCSTDDARLTLENLLDAAGHEAVVLNYARVVGLVRDPSGRVIGARVVDRFTGEETTIAARAVINATGPWSDRTRSLGASNATNRLRTTKGIHAVVDHERLPVQHAVVCFHPLDGRVLFAIPWGEQTYLGTTDTDYPGDPGEVAADSHDVSYLLEAINHYFPSAGLTSADVFSTWAGVRPLISSEGPGAESSVSREHEIAIDADGLITIAGGKLTTYRRMGSEVIDKALGLLMMLGQVPKGLRPSGTSTEPLPGAVGWPEDDDHDKVADLIEKTGAPHLSRRTATMLAGRYGTRGRDIAERVISDPSAAAVLVPGRPEIMAQVDFAVLEELAVTVRDILIRRTQLFFRDTDQGLSACEAVAARMRSLLGWTEQREVAEVLAYQQEVARSRRWRHPDETL